MQYARLTVLLLLVSTVNCQYARQWQYYPRYSYFYGYGSQQTGLSYSQYNPTLNQQLTLTQQPVNPAVSPTDIANYYRPAAPTNLAIYERPLSPSIHTAEQQSHVPGVITLAQQAAANSLKTSTTVPNIQAPRSPQTQSFNGIVGAGIPNPTVATRQFVNSMSKQPAIIPTNSAINGRIQSVNQPQFPFVPSAHGNQPASYAMTKPAAPTGVNPSIHQQHVRNFQQQQQDRIGHFGSNIKSQGLMKTNSNGQSIHSLQPQISAFQQKTQLFGNNHKVITRG
ncbi:hypothetical protein M3Y96_01183500 [Aphelenchoides besseyi]|nr:hypothetical protein M3Y96_01183500 [Aphelenchoides besseyi]